MSPTASTEYARETVRPLVLPGIQRMADRSIGMMRINDELHRALVAAMDGQREVEEGLAEDAQLNAQS